MEREEIIEMAVFHFTKYVKETRQRQRMSLQDLAQRTCLSPAFIYRIETGERRAYLDTRLVILIHGFNWDSELVMEYLERIIENVSSGKKIAN